MTITDDGMTLYVTTIMYLVVTFGYNPVQNRVE